MGGRGLLDFSRRKRDWSGKLTQRALNLFIPLVAWPLPNDGVQARARALRHAKAALIRLLRDEVGLAW